MEATETIETITTKIQQLKADICAKLAVFGENLSENRALEVALALDINFRTVQRYCKGDVKEIRKPAVAEAILAELERLAALDAEKAAEKLNQ